MNPLWLLNLWPAIPALALAWVLHGWDVDRIEARQAQALTEQATALQEQCNANKKITQGVEDAYSKQVNSLGDTIRALRLRKPARCVPIASKPPQRPNAATPEAKLPDGDGIQSEYLIDYAGRAEECRLKLIGLQGFVNQVWKSQ